MNANGHQFHTNASRKNASRVPNRSRAQPHTRAPLTSLRTHASPSTGRLGCMRGGVPMRTEPGPIPRNPRTDATSPNGTPVCAMPNGPGFMPTNSTRGRAHAMRRNARCASHA